MLVLLKKMARYNNSLKNLSLPIYIFKSRGFGHVEFSDKRGVEKALKKQGETIDGRSIKVDVASQR